METFVSEQTRRKGEMVKNNSVEAQKKQAERSFKQEERALDGRKAMAEYEVQARATRAKTERLKALRLAKEAQARTEAPPVEPTKQRPARHEK
jgi:hypothetical protein